MAQRKNAFKRTILNESKSRIREMIIKPLLSYILLRYSVICTQHVHFSFMKMYLLPKLETPVYGGFSRRANTSDSLTARSSRRVVVGVEVSYGSSGWGKCIL